MDSIFNGLRDSFMDRLTHCISGPAWVAHMNVKEQRERLFKAINIGSVKSQYSKFTVIAAVYFRPQSYQGLAAPELAFCQGKALYSCTKAESLSLSLGHGCKWATTVPQASTSAGKSVVCFLTSSCLSNCPPPHDWMQSQCNCISANGGGCDGSVS